MAVEELQNPAWVRWVDWTWEAVFVGCVAVPTVVVLADAPSLAHALTTLGIACGLVAWHWVLSVGKPFVTDQPPRLVWFAGVLAFTWVLVARDQEYLLIIWGLYPQVFGNLGRWAIPGALAATLAVFVPLGMFREGQTASGLRNVLVSTGVAVLIGGTITLIARQSEARKDALEALEATRTELAATSWRAGVLEERTRLAREVHDAVAQGFAGIIMQLEACDLALAADPAGARTHLSRARESARASLNEVRRAVHALRPEPLEGGDLPQALDRTAARWSEETALPAAVTVRGAPIPLAPAAEVALLRVVQESLANVARHASASRADVHVGYGDGLVHVEVSDDGTGFDPSSQTGVGLTGMEERMQAVGGQLAIRSRRGEGTRISAEVPA